MIDLAFWLSMSETTLQNEVIRVQSCRICDNRKLLTFLQLGPTPIPNGFLEPEQLNCAEKFYPLDVCFCSECGMVQLAHNVDSGVMFRNYVYVPSTSQTMNDHFAGLAQYAMQKAALKKTDRVVDIGSNDGFLLKNFLRAGIQVLGVDPAENLAKKANEAGVETIATFFTKNTAEKIVKEKGKVKVILGTNVFAHAPDLHDFLEGVKTLLSDDGLFIVEFPYLMSLMDKVEFDTIYQEHLSYFGLTPIARLIEQHQMGLMDATLMPIHGGSLRVTISPRPCRTSSDAQALINMELARGFLNPETFLGFSKKVNKIRNDLSNLLWEIKLQGKRIVGYGAAAKGNVMLNYCRIGPEILDYVVDSIPYKHGKYTPGMHIPIYPESKLLEDAPDYALLLAWNFADEIVRKQEVYRKNGGKFILSVPEVKII